MRRSALRRGFANAVLALVALALAVVGGELGLRLYFYGTPAQPEYASRISMPHPTRGWAFLPDARGRTQDLAASAPVAINSKGLRGPEMGYERTPGRFRILLIGDSVLFGSGVELEESMPAQLAQRLASERIEVVNLSVPAYGTTQEYVFFMEEGTKYKPDLVLLGFSPSNDIQTSYEPLQRLFQKRLRRPYARLSDGALVIDTHYAEKAAETPPETETGGGFRLTANAVIVRLVQVAWKRATGGRRVDPNIYLGWPYLEAFVPDHAADGQTVADYERLWAEGWTVTRALIGAMQAETQRIGARFAMFVTTSKLQGDTRLRERVQRAFPEARIDVTKIDRELQAFGDSIGAPVLELLPAFLAAAAEGKEMFLGYDDEHWAPEGHALAAETLARQLRERGLVPTSGEPG